MKNISRLLILLVFLLTATQAFANGVPPIIGIPLLHCLILNILIGIIESDLVRRLFKIPNRAGLIILGNYVSCVVGLFVAGISTEAAMIEYYKVQSGDTAAFFVSMLIFTLVSMLIELPFFFRSFRDDVPFFRGLLAATVANLITNAVIVALYYFSNLYAVPP